MSIATDTSVKTVICFDRAATVLFGCSADEFFHFTKINPSAGTLQSLHWKLKRLSKFWNDLLIVSVAASMANQVFDGEMLRVTLTRPHNRNAQHMRVTSIVPLRSGFQPAIITLRQICTKNASLGNCSKTNQSF